MLVTKTATQEQAEICLNYASELRQEMDDILNYWMNNVIDEKKGGFYGAVGNNNVPDEKAGKGVVLNSRILWAFAAAANFTDNPLYKQTADRAFDYLQAHFADKEYGAVYWSVDSNGKMLDGRKQIYGLAFCIYGLVEYYKLTANEAAFTAAKKLFQKIELYSFDSVNGGYTEALTRNWKPIDDLRLSEKDSNEKKTMNTHLHIIEAYANLYTVWPEIFLREKITNLLSIFEKQFLNKSTHQYRLFMTEDWQSKSALQSFGHDVEASWLLYQCAEISGNELYIDKFRNIAIPVANSAAKAIDKDGGMWYEYDAATDVLVKEKHSWPQAEAMIGFFNAYQLSGDEKYLQLSINSWQFVKHHIKDNKRGEWFWGVAEDYSIMQKDKAGFWKCPYHNVRACIEINKRISSIL